MTINTRLFGEVYVEEDKIIVFEEGIIGFPDLRQFTLIRDEEKADSSIMWMQSLEEPGLALTVVDPTAIMEDYRPEVDDELLKSLGNLNPFNTFLLNTITVPSDITKMTMNLKAPIIINSDTNKACQLIVEGDYSVKHAIYQQLKEAKEKTQESQTV